MTVFQKQRKSDMYKSRVSGVSSPSLAHSFSVTRIHHTQSIYAELMNLS